jgi:hypothetical protein
MLPIVRKIILSAGFTALMLSAVRATPQVMHDLGIVAPQAWGQR